VEATGGSGVASSPIWSRIKGGEIAARIQREGDRGEDWVCREKKNEREGVWFCFWKRGVLH